MSLNVNQSSNILKNTNLEVDTIQNDQLEIVEEQRRDNHNISSILFNRKITGNNKECKEWLKNKIIRNLNDTDFTPKTYSIPNASRYNIHCNYQIDDTRFIEIENKFMNQFYQPIIKIYNLESGRLQLNKKLTKLYKGEIGATKYSNDKVITYGEEPDENNNVQNDFLRIDYLDDREPIEIKAKHNNKSRLSNRSMYDQNMLELDNGHILTLSSSGEIVEWDPKEQKSQIVFTCESKSVTEYSYYQKLLRTEEGYFIAVFDNVITVFHDDQWKKPFVRIEEGSISRIVREGNLLAYNPGSFTCTKEIIKILDVSSGKICFSQTLKGYNDIKDFCFHKDHLYMLRKYGEISKINWQKQGDEEVLCRIKSETGIHSMKMSGGLLFVACSSAFGGDGATVILDPESQKIVKETRIEWHGHRKFGIFTAENRGVISKIVTNDPNSADTILFQDYLVGNEKKLNE